MLHSGGAVLGLVLRGTVGRCRARTGSGSAPGGWWIAGTFGDVAWEDATEDAAARGRLAAVRGGVPLVSVVVVVVAAASDPAGWVRPLVLAVAVAMFVLWAWVPRLSTPLLAVGVLVPVFLAQLSGRLEPAMFLLAVLTVVVARWEKAPWRVGVVCAVVLASPVVLAALQPSGNHLAWKLWVIGLAFSVAVGLLVRREVQLLGELERARRRLAAQALAEERRRIARDVHDLVGHGLAAVLLQVVSARHVLRRDVDAADEALAAAELAGRRSMQELRGTVALLRSGDESSITGPLPSIAALGGLVDAAARDGLSVGYRPVGDVADVDPAVGLALYRIAQEALHNAARYAPRARTVVAVTAVAGAVTLEVDSVGPLEPPSSDRDRPRYGLVGMRERAATVAGELRAGPTRQGWRVCCRIPAAPE